MSGPPQVAYKVLTHDQYVELSSSEKFAGAPVDIADGFIHLSTIDQLAETLDRHFSGQTGLFIAEIDLARLGGTVKWEESRGGQLFPHIYGSLCRSAIRKVFPLDRDPYGNIRIPPER